MSSPRFSDEELKKDFGMRGGGTALFYPQEFGYRCPEGHSDLTWSEFNEHIWCYECKKDYHSMDEAIMVQYYTNPVLPRQPLIIMDFPNFGPDGDGFTNVPKELIEKTRKEAPQ